MKNYLYSPFIYIVISLLIVPRGHAANASDDAAATSAADTDTIETVVVTGERKNLYDEVRGGWGDFRSENGVEVISGRRGVQSFLIRGRDDYNLIVNHALSSPYDTSSLDDIPDEMIKSIKIYHARSAELAEGGGAGTIEVEYKQPLDFAAGANAAGSATAGNDSTRRSASGLWHGSASGLMAYRTQIGANDLGGMVSGKFRRDNRASFASTSGMPVESADVFGTLPDAIASSQTFDDVSYDQSFLRERNYSLNFAAQWRHGAYALAINASYGRGHMDSLTDSLDFYASDTSASVTGYALARGGAFLKSVGISTANNTVNGGPEAGAGRTATRSETVSVMPSWTRGSLSISSYAIYTHNRTRGHNLGTQMRFSGTSSVDIDFSPDDRNAYGPEMVFEGVDLADPQSYLIDSFRDNYSAISMHQYIGSVNVSYSLADISWLKSFSVGYSGQYLRQTNRTNYRYATLYQDDTQSDYLRMSAFPACGDSYRLIHHGAIRGTKWYRLSSSCLFSQYHEIVGVIAEGIASGTVSSADDWSVVDEANVSNLGRFRSSDSNHAAFAQLTYGLSSPLRIDGMIGVRAVYETMRYRGEGETESLSAETGTDGYVSYIPNASLNIGLSNTVSVQGTYTYNITSPSTFSYLGTGSVNTYSKVIRKGYSRLDPQTEQDYIVGLVFGSGRSRRLSLKYFLNRIHGKPYMSGITDTDEASSTYGYTIYAYRNSGHGGYEGADLSFQQTFDFLPGRWRDFGINGGATWMTSYKMTYPYDNAYTARAYDADLASRIVGKFGVFYDSDRFGANVMYKFKGAYRMYTYETNPLYSPYSGYSASLDAQFNFYFGDHVILKFKGYNLLGAAARSRWGLLGPFRGIELKERRLEFGVSVM